jgi:hypothetical protein
VKCSCLNQVANSRKLESSLKNKNKGLDLRERERADLKFWRKSVRRGRLAASKGFPLVSEPSPIFPGVPFGSWAFLVRLLHGVFT